MFNKIKIERFRGIKYASIEGLKQINLFFGKNRQAGPIYGILANMQPKHKPMEGFF